MTPTRARPPTLPLKVENIPHDLRARPQWVLWRWEERDGNWTKVPIDPRTGWRADSTNPASWGTFEEALDRAQEEGVAGIGYVLSADDPYVGVDLDKCRDPLTGIANEALGITRQLNSYAEISQSGTGLHIFVRGTLPAGGNRKGHIEMYDRGRFLIVTGHHLPDTPATIEERQEELAALHEALFPVPQRARVGANGAGHAAAADGDEWGGAEHLSADAGEERFTDDEVLALARRAKNANKFNRLWAGDTSGHDDDDSRADLALLSILAFYTGPGTSAQLDRLFRQSGLMRYKWERQDYRERTIAEALNRDEWYTPGGVGGGTHRGDSVTSDEGEEGQGHEGQGQQGRKSQATRLVELAEGANLELFHTPEGEAYATIPVGDHAEVWPLKSKSVRQWLARQYYHAQATAPNAQATQDALGVLEGKALYEGPEAPVYTRLAEHGGAICLDLGDAAWRAVVITAQGWEVIARPPVRFRRPRGLAPLPIPMPGGDLADLRRFLNIASDDDWTLCVAWLLGACRPRGPYPVLALHGEQGSAKSTTARVLRALVDPSTVPLRAEPREERDLAIAATNTWVLAFDNLSRLPGWLSDALCRLATGGGFATRELYSDRDEALFDAQRPVLLTGIEELATRSDLLDRTIVRYLPAIADERRRDEATFWGDFTSARPAILGALLTAVSGALARLSTIALPRVPRLADFALWVTAAEPALGWAPGTFLRAYEGNRAEANDLALDASPVALAVRSLAAEHPEASPWLGTATALLTDLAKRVEEPVTKGRDWPKTARALSGILRRYAPNLRAAGVVVTTGEREDGGNRRRLITLYQNRDATDRPNRPNRPDPCHDKGNLGTQNTAPPSQTDPFASQPSHDRPNRQREHASADAETERGGDGGDGGDDEMQPCSHGDDDDDDDAADCSAWGSGRGTAPAPTPRASAPPSTPGGGNSGEQWTWWVERS